MDEIKPSMAMAEAFEHMDTALTMEQDPYRCPVCHQFLDEAWPTIIKRAQQNQVPTTNELVQMINELRKSIDWLICAVVGLQKEVFHKEE